MLNFFLPMAICLFLWEDLLEHRSISARINRFLLFVNMILEPHERGDTGSIVSFTQLVVWTLRDV